MLDAEQKHTHTCTHTPAHTHLRSQSAAEGMSPVSDPPDSLVGGPSHSCVCVCVSSLTLAQPCLILCGPLLSHLLPCCCQPPHFYWGHVTPPLSPARSALSLYSFLCLSLYCFISLSPSLSALALFLSLIHSLFISLFLPLSFPLSFCLSLSLSFAYYLCMSVSLLPPSLPPAHPPSLSISLS